MCKPIAGARESNAGDDFHLVWAAKKALALLEPNTNFKALSVEGPSLEDERNFEIDSKDLLSIDVAEYYGDKTFETASNVIFSQLKYSTRNANKDWTLANLCTPTNKKKDNSIIRRLAQTYDGYDKRYSNLESKLVLKLVSNKKIEVDLIQLFNTCKEAITKEDIVQYVQLKGSLKSQSEKDMLKRLYSETKLESKKFIGFLLCLDFSDCGASIREIQSSEVIQKLRLWGNTDLKSDYNNLIMFINKQMTPEAANLGPIDKYSVLGILSQTEDLMFPARSHIFHVKDYVERDITSKIIEDNEFLEKFDREIFESVIDKVIAGKIDENGNVNPYSITFIFKTGLEIEKKDIKDNSYLYPLHDTGDVANKTSPCQHLV
jgi:hypothetical protein